MELMEVQDLCYSYDQELALDHLCFKVRKGEVTAVLGGNGAGKSTLFLNLNGVLKPDSGTVFWNGTPIRYDRKGIRELGRKIGIVFQDPNDQLFSDSVRNDIAFGALNMGYSKQEAERKVEEVAAQVGITSLLNRPTHALSFGQKKRVALAGVLIMQPEVMILDEPTAGLDPAGVTDIMNLLLQIQKESGIALVLSTHEIDLVPLYCSYAYVLNEGRVVLEGAPRVLFEDAAALRAHHLRTPRITHLMEILNRKDCLPVDRTAATISQARAAIKELL